MPTVEQRIIQHIELFPGCSEIEIARTLWGPTAVQQRVNAHIRRLCELGAISRSTESHPYTYNLGIVPLPAGPGPQPVKPDQEHLSEDQIKVVLREWLENQGWTVKVAMGKERGIDIEAHRGMERWIIEVKGPGSRQPMKVNYFISMLGETLQRMNDENAKYSIALPDHRQFRNLWSRLPQLAKQRTAISAIFDHPGIGSTPTGTTKPPEPLPAPFHRGARGWGG